MRTQQFTHKGWFGLCPVYLAELESDAPHVTPRVENWFFNGLFLASHYAFVAYFIVADLVSGLFNLDWEPGFPIVVTEQMLVPYTLEYEDDEEGHLL